MREDVKKLKGCMKPEVSEDGEDIFHEIALDLANECDPCLDIIIAHQRRETLEECAKVVEANCGQCDVDLCSRGCATAVDIRKLLPPRPSAQEHEKTKGDSK